MIPPALADLAAAAIVALGASSIAVAIVVWATARRLLREWTLLRQDTQATLAQLRQLAGHGAQLASQAEAALHRVEQFAVTITGWAGALGVLGRMLLFRSRRHDGASLDKPPALLWRTVLEAVPAVVRWLAERRASREESAAPQQPPEPAHPSPAAAQRPGVGIIRPVGVAPAGGRPGAPAGGTPSAAD